MKHNDTQCVYMAEAHDESLFQKCLRKCKLGHVALTHNHKLENFRVVYKIEEGRFCHENKVVNICR